MTIWSRIWPRELEIYKSNPKAIPMAGGPYPHLCNNCGGHGVMMVFVIDGGPYPSPVGRVKWLDLPENPPDPQTPRKSGWYSGKLEMAHCPVCKEGRMDAYIQQNCGLSGSDLVVSIEDFKTGGVNAEKVEAKRVAMSLLAMNQSPNGFVLFTGSYGVGKTHLLKAITNGFRMIRVMARYSTMTDLLAEIRERFGDDHGVRAVEDAIDDLRRAKVLCIDEIDRVNMTAWAKETIFRLLNARYEERENLLTVMATNLDIDDMPPELGYLASRFSGGIVVQVPGPDMRQAQGIKARKELLEGVLS